MKFIITDHAAIQFTRRGKLYAPISAGKDIRLMKEFLAKVLGTESYRDIRFEQVPFYVNKLTVRHPNEIFFIWNGFRFCCKPKGSNMVVTTSYQLKKQYYP